MGSLVDRGVVICLLLESDSGWCGQTAQAVYSEELTVCREQDEGKMLTYSYFASEAKQQGSKVDVFEMRGGRS